MCVLEQPITLNSSPKHTCMISGEKKKCVCACACASVEGTDGYQHAYITTIPTSPPCLRHYHAYITAIPTSPPCLRHYHAYITTMPTSPPCLRHYHAYITTMPTSPPCLAAPHYWPWGSSRVATAPLTCSRAGACLWALAPPARLDYRVLGQLLCLLPRAHHHLGTL